AKASSRPSSSLRTVTSRVTAMSVPPSLEGQSTTARRVIERDRMVRPCRMGARGAGMNRYGMTIPLDGVPLAAQREGIQELEALGYGDVWSAEAGGYDGLTPLALASVWAPSLRLGVAILPAFTRGPGLLAMSVASLCQAAPGRFVVGIGTSSDVIVERWNGIAFNKPYQRVRDSVRFLRKALSGEKVSEDFESFKVDGFRLGVKVDPQPKILVAALRQGMLRLAGRVGDGAIINWLSADDVKKVAPLVREGGAG